MLLIMFSTFLSTRINNVAVGTEVVGILGLTILLIVAIILLLTGGRFGYRRRGRRF